MNQEHIDTIGRGWIHDVKDQVENASLARAGLAVIRLVSFALKTQHDEQFGRDVDSCVKMFWARCERESQPPAVAQPDANGEPLPCPFCGGKARLYDYDTDSDTWPVECDNPDCGARVQSKDSPEYAIAAWNRRAPQPPAPSVPTEAIETVLDFGIAKPWLHKNHEEAYGDAEDTLRAWLAAQSAQDDNTKGSHS